MKKIKAPWHRAVFVDANCRTCQAGDTVEYQYGARRGVLCDVAQDGDASVTFHDTGTTEIVKWVRLCKVVGG